jgi:hypothetical protein
MYSEPTHDDSGQAPEPACNGQRDRGLYTQQEWKRKRVSTQEKSTIVDVDILASMHTGQRWI